MKSRMLVKVGKKYFLLSLAEIDYIRAEGNYVRIFLGEETYLVRKTITDMEERLDAESFLRVNRSTIVNANKIREFSGDSEAGFVVVMKDDKEWNWGKKYRKELMDNSL